MNRSDRTPNPNDLPGGEAGRGDRGLLFISHRHADKKIADVIRDFVETRSLGRIRVFQSSGVGTGARIGGTLNQELMDRLREAQSLILVYTTGDQDWSYCMWECGVAVDPSQPDTREIVFQCGTDVPQPFHDKVRVNIRNRDDVKRFVGQFFTDPGFFPRLGEAIAPDWRPDGRKVTEAADELFADLQEAAPSLKVQPDDEWPAFGYIQLQLGLEEAREIERARGTSGAAGSPERKGDSGESRHGEEEPVDLVRANAVVHEADYVAAGLFGMPNIQRDTPVERLVQAWRRDADEDDSWIGGLLAQVAQAACWNFPQRRWNLMRARDGRWYAPAVYRVRKLPSRNCMRFDVYFLPLESDDAGEPRIPAR